ncbi:unnamed protein product [Effrenium voratum]|uniref:Ataxin-10 domain-containing protein n=1 Tax=Effrenium voratum TaxID=2562239 RepID=A0AA36JFM9_9DINO|nr:unnamed protein product [Effrenium voratum]
MFGERRGFQEDEALLERLGDLLERCLAALAGFAPDGSGGYKLSESSEQPGPDVLAAEAAGAACLKLARNLAAGCSDIQARWWRRGLVERLAVQARCDLAAPGGQRSLAWCEAVPSFMANVVAGNEELRAEALQALQPHGLAAVLALCWQRPDHGFLLLQNLCAGGGLDISHGGLLYMVLSLLRAVEEVSPAVAAKAKDWAAIFFSSLWSQGLFAEVFASVKKVTPAELHGFLHASAAVPGWGALKPGAAKSSAEESFGLIMSRMCGRREALGLLWHTIRGLLGSLDSEQGDGVGAASPEALRLARRLLGDDSFVDLARQEMSAALVRLAAAHSLKLELDIAPASACEVLTLHAEDLDVAALAARGLEEHEQSEEEGAFREMLLCAVDLAALPCGTFPPKLAGLYLWGNVKLMAALHHLRFGTAAVAETGVELPARQEPKSGDPTAAVKAAFAGQLVTQLRLCGNVLFESPEAAEFLRLSGGLPTLLSHCYADPELPLLREAGIFAVRNATQHSSATREEVKQLLAERRTRDPNRALPMVDESALLS